MLSSTFPREWIQKNTEESASILKSLGNPSRVLNTLFDNDTDTLMINNAYSTDPNNTLESALLGRRNYLPEKQQTVYQDMYVESNMQTEENYIIQDQLIRTVNNNISESFEYARYWHGYVAFLRPLLIFLNFNEIRALSTGLLAFLALIALMLLYKRIKFKYCFVIILALLCSEYFIMGFTLQGLMTFVISMISTIIICIRFDKIKNIGLYFFSIGMVTCYFDLLTHPLITLGIPMIIYLLIKQEKGKISLKEAIKIIVKNTLLWGMGWIITNLTKWIIVDILYNRNLIYKSIMQFIFRSLGTSEENLAWYMGLSNNWNWAFRHTLMFFTTLIFYVIYTLIRNYKNITINVKQAIPYLMIFMPIAWFMVMVNHTWFHFWFTWRNLILFYIGIGIFLLKLFGEKDETEIIEKVNEKSKEKIA